MKKLTFGVILFFTVSALFANNAFEELIALSCVLAFLGILKLFSKLYMASKHHCQGDKCSEENHLTWRLLSSVGILNPDVNPLKSLDFIIQFMPKENNNICSLEYSQHYMNLSSGLWQVCVSDISIFYDSDSVPTNCHGGVLAVKTNLVLSTNERGYSQQVILDKFYFQKLTAGTLVDLNDIEFKKNENKTWFTINSNQKIIKVTIDSYLGSPSTLCSGKICVTLLFRKLK